jgi:signal transduction histidine kinase
MPSDDHARVTPLTRRPLGAFVTCAALIAAVTGVVAVIEPNGPAEGLGVLYILAVVPVALLYGRWVAFGASIVSMAVFDYLFLPPRNELDPGVSDNWFVLIAFLAAAVTTSELAARAEREAQRGRRLAAEQAALRRVATLVAQGVPPEELFEAVAREIGQFSDADLARLERYEEDGTVTAVGTWARHDRPGLSLGQRFELEGESIAQLVRDSGGPARIDSFEDAAGPIAREAQALGIRSSVGSPIIVGGRVWGVIAASRWREERFARGTESKLGEFTDLVATAIANAEADAELAASRTRILAAADDARRRLVRDLHDGAQQRLVHTIISLKLAARELEEDSPAKPILAEALAQAERSNAELRELAHGVLPAVLSRGGLRAGVDALIDRVDIPVDVDVTAQRLPPGIEASAYFVVAEALTNVVKHSRARRAAVSAQIEDGTLRLGIRDDGIGGASRWGTGLVGLGDRVAAIGGALEVESPPGEGTAILATLPLPDVV